MRRISVALAAAVLCAATAAAVTPAQAQPSLPAEPAAAGKHWLAATKPAAIAARAIAGRAVPAARLSPVPALAASLAGSTASPALVGVRVSGSEREIAAAVARAGGRIAARGNGSVYAKVPGTDLVSLASSAGVTQVTRPVRAVREAPTEGVGASGATAWQSANLKGSGVKVGVIDSAYSSPSTEVTAGHDFTGGTCSTDAHGTAVADIIAQMAPLATIIKACVDESNGFQDAAARLIDVDGVSIISSSLGFPGDSRGDGTGDANSTVATVRAARQKDVLFVVSAGNNGGDHWGGTFADSDRDRYLDINGANDPADAVGVAAGGSADLVLEWDQWPSTSLAVSLRITPFDTNGNPGTSFFRGRDGASPVVEVCFVPGGGAGCYDSNSATYFPSPASGVQAFLIQVVLPSSFPAVRYDLSYWGETTYNDLSCATFDANGNCIAVDPRGSGHSITAPATSPYALAVGAVDVNKNRSGCHSPAGGSATYPLELYSSQGPTIDGRIKPDLVAFDNVSSNRVTLNPFCGTSAAAPHVAGAAALIAGANPSLDATQIQRLLEKRAGLTVPTNSLGHGILKLGATTGVVPDEALKYSTLPGQVRILSTLSGPLPGNRPIGKMNAGEGLLAFIPDSVPADAKSVWVMLTGLNATTQTTLTLYGDTPALANLTVDRTENAVNVGAQVPIGHFGTQRAIRIANAAGQVDAIIDVVGAFSPTAGDRHQPMSPVRLLSTTGPGIHQGAFVTGEEFAIRVRGVNGVPATATVAAINLATLGSLRGTGYLSAYASPHGATTPRGSLSYGRYGRSNLVFVPIGSDGFIRIFNKGQSVNVIVDMVGWFGPAGSQRFVPLSNVTRIVDTSTGLGGYHDVRRTNTASLTHVNDLFETAHSATAILANFVVVAPAGIGDGYLAAYPAPASPRPPTSTLQYTGGRTVVNAAVAKSNGGTLVTYVGKGPVRIIALEFGYFIAGAA